MNEITRLNELLRVALRGNGALSAALGARVFTAIAPAKDPATGLAPALPYVILWNAGRRLYKKTGGSVHHGVAVYGIKVVGYSEEAMESLADAVVTAIDGLSGTLRGLRLVSVTRSDAGLPELVEIVDGRRVVHIGDRFDIHWEWV